jgi:hypothetical protein
MTIALAASPVLSAVKAVPSATIDACFRIDIDFFLQKIKLASI